MIAAEIAVTIIAIMINGSKYSEAALLEGLGGGLISAGLGFLAEKYKPGPEDSVGTWAKAVVGPKLASLYFSGPLNKLWGERGPYRAAALRVGDRDELCNPIQEGFPTVKIEGCPAARVGDAVGCSGVAVKYGAKTVTIGGKVAARVDDPLTWGSKSCINSSFLNGASRTNIGGVINWDPDKDPESDKPEIPEEVKKQSESVPTENGGAPGGERLEYAGVFGPDKKAQMPEAPGIYFDKPASEYRIWDPFGIKSWSSTLTEQSNLLDIGAFGDIFESNGSPALALKTETQGHWYLFGGLVDLGSPNFPGAGTGTYWFIPDTICGLDMSPYFFQHDWIYYPASERWDGRSGAWTQFLEQEWQPYLTGAQSFGPNPFGQV
ncbi:MAG: PAAR domain-containing protein, partial [Saprospiraceae bacterium]